MSVWERWVGGSRVERERPRSRDWQPKGTKMNLKLGYSQAVFESEDATPGCLRNRKSRDDFSAGWLFQNLDWVETIPLWRPFLGKVMKNVHLSSSPQ